VREQISSEMWEQLNRLYLQVRETRLDDIWNVSTHEFFRSVKEGAHRFQGITDTTMTHGEGWQFMQVGRYMERATTTAALLDMYANEFLAQDGADAGGHAATSTGSGCSKPVRRSRRTVKSTRPPCGPSASRSFCS
jgi:uncharacterized alpha-E superfamily protein